MCNRALRFQEFAQNSVPPLSHLEKAGERTQLRTNQPPHSLQPGPETDRNANWRLAGLQTKISKTSPNLRWSEIAVKPSWSGGGVIWVVLRPDFHRKFIKMYVKRSFVDVLYDIQKDSEDVSAGMVIEKNWYLRILPGIWRQSWQGQLWHSSHSSPLSPLASHPLPSLPVVPLECWGCSPCFHHLFPCCCRLDAPVLLGRPIGWRPDTRPHPPLLRLACWGARLAHWCHRCCLHGPYLDDQR